MARAGSSLNDSGPVAPHSLQLTASIARSWSTAITSRSSLAQNGQDSGFIGKSITPGGAFGNWAMACMDLLPGLKKLYVAEINVSIESDRDNGLWPRRCSTLSPRRERGKALGAPYKTGRQPAWMKIKAIRGGPG